MNSLGQSNRCFRFPHLADRFSNWSKLKLSLKWEKRALRVRASSPLSSTHTHHALSLFRGKIFFDDVIKVNRKKNRQFQKSSNFLSTLVTPSSRFELLRKKTRIHKLPLKRLKITLKLHQNFQQEAQVQHFSAFLQFLFFWRESRKMWKRQFFPFPIFILWEKKKRQNVFLEK